MEQVRKESKTLRPFFVKNDDMYIANDLNVRRYNGNRMYVSLNANHQEWLCPPPSPRGRNKKAAIKGGR